VSRRKKSRFANIETAEQLAEVLKQSDCLTIAEVQAAKMLMQLKGWGTHVTTVDDSQSQIAPTGTNLSKLRQQLAEGLRSDDPALDWIRNSPDEIFRQRVERITGSPIRTESEQRDFAIRVCGEALQFVQEVRRSFGGRVVSMDECISTLAKGSEKYLLWDLPTHREALRIILEAQSPDGYSVPWIVKKPQTER
jgi:hypothetical protein